MASVLRIEVGNGTSQDSSTCRTRRRSAPRRRKLTIRKVTISAISRRRNFTTTPYTSLTRRIKRVRRTGRHDTRCLRNYGRAGILRRFTLNRRRTRRKSCNDRYARSSKTYLITRCLCKIFRVLHVNRRIRTVTRYRTRCCNARPRRRRQRLTLSRMCRARNGSTTMSCERRRRKCNTLITRTRDSSGTSSRRDRASNTRGIRLSANKIMNALCKQATMTCTRVKVILLGSTSDLLRLICRLTILTQLTKTSQQRCVALTSKFITHRRIITRRYRLLTFATPYGLVYRTPTRRTARSCKIIHSRQLRRKTRLKRRRVMIINRRLHRVINHRRAISGHVVLYLGVQK